VKANMQPCTAVQTQLEGNGKKQEELAKGVHREPFTSAYSKCSCVSVRWSVLPGYLDAGHTDRVLFR
jgi:hypothetical protein